MKNVSPFYLVILALAAILWLPGLLQKGMFMDGIYNAIIASNYAQGAPFWAPQGIEYSDPAYWGNPPLTTFFLGGFYKLLGDHYHVERIYSLCCALVQMVLLWVLWRIYFKHDKQLQRYAWLPVLLWLISPLTGWCYSSNMMENTMSVFTTASVICAVAFIKTTRLMPVYAGLGSAIVFLAVITKGPAGLFPLAAPVLFMLGLTGVSRTKLAMYGLMQLVAFAAIFALAFSAEAPALFLHNYLYIQLKPVLIHEAGAKYVPYEILIQLLITLLPLLIIGALPLVFKNKLNITETYNRNAPVFLLIGLSASLPIMLSTKQHKFYLLPALPMFAIAFAIWVAPLAQAISDKLSETRFGIITTGIKFSCVLVFAVCILLCFINKGGYTRDEAMIKEVEAIKPLIATESAIIADGIFYDQWVLRAYMYRFNHVKIAMPGDSIKRRYLLAQPSGENRISNATKLYKGERFDLYKWDTAY